MSPLRLAVLQGQLGYGGSERQLLLFLEQCDRRVWAPHVYVGTSLGCTAVQVQELGVPVTLLQGSRLQKLRQFRRGVRDQRAEALLSWSSWTNVFAWTLVGSRVPRFGSYRNAGFSDLPQRQRRLWSWASRVPLTEVLCNSAETAEELRRHVRPGQPVHFLPNAVEPVSDVAGHRRRWRQELGIGENEILVMGIGRLAPQKAFDRFVEAVALCHTSQPVRAVIVGPDYGGVRHELEAQIAQLGLPDGTLRCVGPTDSPQEMVCAADVYLLSSTHEGMPNVVMEAMSAGVPCVTTPVSGIGSFLTNEVDGLVAGHDPDSMSKALRRLVEDPDLRAEMGARARQRLRRDSAPDTVYRPLWTRLQVSVDAAAANRSTRTARLTRFADVSLCLLALPVALPVGSAIGLAVRATSRGPALHHAVRAGKDGVPFRLHKFRSMRLGAAETGPGITAAGDPRVTRLGSWLRRSKLDELPQLINVLKGEMSLVGPRPEDPRYVDLERPEQRAALTVRPGITSPASILFRSEEQLLVGPDWERAYREHVLPRKLSCDTEYLREATVRSYTRVLLLTLLTVLPRVRPAPSGVPCSARSAST